MGIDSEKIFLHAVPNREKNKIKNIDLSYDVLYSVFLRFLKIINAQKNIRHKAAEKKKIWFSEPKK